MGDEFGKTRIARMGTNFLTTDGHKSAPMSWHTFIPFIIYCRRLGNPTSRNLTTIVRTIGRAKTTRAPTCLRKAAYNCLELIARCRPNRHVLTICRKFKVFSTYHR